MKKYFCPFCGNELSRNGIHHIYSCKKNIQQLSKDDIRMLYIRYNFGDEIIGGIVEDYTNDFSLPMLKEKYGVDYKTIQFILNKNGITIRGISESAKLISQDKYKKTCMERYGVENISQLKETKEKKAKTFEEHYGVDNIWRLSSYNKMCAELYPEEHEEHMKKLHNGRNEYFKNATAEEKTNRLQKMYASQAENGVYNSKLELRVCKIFEDLGLSYTRQFHLKGYKHPYDFYLCDSKIIFEVNGDFWHANPLMYEETDVLNFPKKKQAVKDIWERDKKHIEKANECGYKVIVLWEKDIRKMTDDELKGKIVELLNEI